MTDKQAQLLFTDAIERAEYFKQEAANKEYYLKMAATYEEFAKSLVDSGRLKLAEEPKVAVKKATNYW